MDDETLTEETASPELEEPLVSEVVETEEEQTPTEEIAPEPIQAQTAPAVEHSSPYRATPTDMPAEFAELIDPNVYKAILKIADDRADQRVAMALQAQAQSREAVRALGLPTSVADEYGTSMARYETQIPPEMRGTKQGAIAAFSLALGEKMMAGGSVADVLKAAAGHFDTKPAQLPTARAVTPPEERMTSPRTNPAPARVTGERKPSGPYSYLAARWGASDDEMKALRESADEVIAETARRR